MKTYKQMEAQYERRKYEEKRDKERVHFQKRMPC